MKTFFTAICLAISAVALAQDGTFKGHITSDDLPLEAVSVQLESKTTKKWTTSNRKGEFSLSLPAGEYRLKVLSLGYIPYNDKVTITAGATTEQNIALKEDVLGIDEVVITATKTKENRKDAPVLVSVT